MAGYNASVSGYIGGLVDIFFKGGLKLQIVQYLQERNKISAITLARAESAATSKDNNRQ